VRSFDDFNIRHISRVENFIANDLAQEASGYRVTRRKFHISENPIIRGALSSHNADRSGGAVGPSVLASDRPGSALGRGPSTTNRSMALIDSSNDAADAVDWGTPFFYIPA
jgi:hypothetical protein